LPLVIPKQTTSKVIDQIASEPVSVQQPSTSFSGSLGGGILPPSSGGVGSLPTPFPYSPEPSHPPPTTSGIITVQQPVAVQSSYIPYAKNITPPEKKSFWDFLGYWRKETTGRWFSYFAFPDVSRRLQVSFESEPIPFGEWNEEFWEAEEQNYQRNLQMIRDRDWGGLTVKFLENPLVNAPIFYGGTIGLGFFSKTAVGESVLFYSKNVPAVTPSHFVQAGVGAAFTGYTVGGFQKSYVEGGVPALRHQLLITGLTLPAYMDIGRSGYYRGQELGVKYRGIGVSSGLRGVLNKPLYTKTVGDVTYPVSTRTLINRFTNKIQGFKTRSSSQKWQSWSQKYGIEGKYKPQTIMDYVKSKVKPSKTVQRSVGKRIGYTDAAQDMLNKMFKQDETSTMYRESGFEVAQFLDTGETIVRKIKQPSVSSLEKFGFKTISKTSKIKPFDWEKPVSYESMRSLGLPDEPIVRDIVFSKREINILSKKFVKPQVKTTKITKYGKTDVLRSPDSEIVTTKYKEFYYPMEKIETVAKDTRSFFERNRISPDVIKKFKITDADIARYSRINEKAFDVFKTTPREELSILKLGEVKKFDMKPLDIRFYGQDIVKQISPKKSSLRFYAGVEQAGLPKEPFVPVEKAVPHKAGLSDLFSIIEPKVEKVLPSPRKIIPWSETTVDVGTPFRIVGVRGGRGGIWAEMFGYTRGYDVDEEIISKQWKDVAPVYVSKPSRADILGLNQFLSQFLRRGTETDVVSRLERGSLTSSIVIQDLSNIQKNKVKQMTDTVQKIVPVTVTETSLISTPSYPPFVPKTPKILFPWDKETKLKKIKKNDWLSQIFGTSYRYRKHRVTTLSDLLGFDINY